MSASYNMKKGKELGVDIGRGVETNDAPVEAFVLIYDENDRLYCPGVLDEPSPGLIQSLRNGWEKGSLIKCTDRAKKGEAPILAVGEGRSRIKGVTIVNAERAAAGLPPIRPQYVTMSEDELYIVMHTSANKQERRPSFEARKWKQFCAMYAKFTLGKTGLDEGEVVKARKEYSELHKCSSATVRAWDLLLSAHPEVLRMFDAGEPGLKKQSAVLDIVNNVAYANQPEAARRVVAAAKAKHEPPVEQKSEPVPTPNDVVMHTHFEPVATPAPEPAKASRGTRSERTDRRAALGIDTTRTISTKKLSDLSIELRKIDEPELVDPRVFLAMIMGEMEFDGLPIDSHPSMGEVARSARRVGIKVSK